MQCTSFLIDLLIENAVYFIFFMSVVRVIRRSRGILT